MNIKKKLLIGGVVAVLVVVGVSVYAVNEQRGKNRVAAFKQAAVEIQDGEEQSAVVSKLHSTLKKNIPISLKAGLNLSGAQEWDTDINGEYWLYMINLNQQRKEVFDPGYSSEIGSSYDGPVQEFREYCYAFRNYLMFAAYNNLPWANELAWQYALSGCPSMI